MSEIAIELEGLRPRPWWLVWLGGALAPAALGLTILQALSLIVPPLPHRPHPDNIQVYILANDAPLFAAIALPTGLLLVAIMAFAERAHPQPFGRWIAAGFAASTPMALYLAASVTTWLGVLLYGFGLLGTAIAYRIRHGGRAA